MIMIQIIEERIFLLTALILERINSRVLIKKKTIFFNFIDKNKNVVNNNSNSLLVDCEATAHIVNDEFLFIKKNINFNIEKHFIKLANST